jgi:hypothetical protein
MDQFARPQRPAGFTQAERTQEEVQIMQQTNNTTAIGSVKKGFSLSNLPQAAMLIAVAALIGLMLASIVFGGKEGAKITDAVDENKYQALFLSSNDGQVYFGKLASYNSEYYVLRDIYYPKVEQKLQPGQSSDQAQQVISLAKLGNELHGPVDEMFVPKEKVLYWENLKDDGQVVKAITEYKKNPTASTTTSATPTVAPTPTPVK